jgi:transcriptional regulator with XRE-family HTH domain
VRVAYRACVGTTGSKVDSAHPIAAALRKARLQRGETLESLSTKTGLSLAHLSRLERSKDEPSEKIRISYAQALGLPDAHFSGALTRFGNEYFDEIRDAIRAGIDESANPIEPSRSGLKIYERAAVQDLSEFENVCEQLFTMFRNSGAARGVLLLSSGNPLIRSGNELQVAYDDFLARSDGRTARLDCILRLSGIDHRAENISLLSQAVRWVLRYHHLSESGNARAFSVHTIQSEQTLKFPIDIIGTDDLGYIVALPTLEPYQPRGGFRLPLLRSDGGKDSIVRYLDRIIEEATPAIRVYGGSAAEESKFVREELRTHEAWPYLMEHRFFTDMTLPIRQILDPSSSARRAMNWRSNEEAAGIIAAAQKSRIENLEENLRSGMREFRQVCLMTSIEYWAKTGLRDDYPYKNYHYATSKEERIEHLDRIIELLSRYPNFKIAIRSDVDDDQGEFWAVQGDSRVMVARERPDVHTNAIKGNLMNILIRDHNVASVITEWFSEQWNTLQPVDRNKRDVIGFLTKLNHDLRSR